MTPDDAPSPGGADAVIEDRRQQLEREESTTSYPIIGDGYSDTISVVSDITMPTVMPGAVPLEEHYLSPPMQIGFSRKAAKQKLRRPSEQESRSSKQEQNTSPTPVTTPTKPTPDVQPSPAPPVVAKAGGAAAKRRLNYQITMAQLEAARGNLTTPTTIPEVGAGSLLGKSSQYAASVSATAASLQTMTLSTTKGVEPSSKEKIRMPKRLTDATTTSSKSPTSPNPGFASASKSNNNGNNNDTAPQGFANFNAVVVESKRSNIASASAAPKLFDDSGFPNSGFSSRGTQDMNNFFSFGNGNDTTGGSSSFGNTNLFDNDGFPVAMDGSHDPFAISSFDNDFPHDSYSGSKNDSFASGDSAAAGKSFFPAPTMI